jgi:cytochrome c peroxidase
MRRTVLGSVAASLLILSLAACAERPTEPTRDLTPRGPSADVAASSSAAAVVRQLAAGRGIVPLRRTPVGRPALVKLGQALLFDPILSGNRDMSCATCHLPGFATGDGRSLSLGQGAHGLGPARVHPLGTYIPRNAPPLFNLAAMSHLSWDGRVERLANGTLKTPAGAQLTPEMARVFEFGPASALGMFPVTNRAEMRGDGAGNELAAFPDSDLPGIWRALMKRLGAIPQYRAMFEAAYPGTPFDEMTFAHASNAIGGFMVDQMAFTDTPWDRFLAGDDRALSAAQLDGAQTFLTLKCSICHNGATFSDEQFHNVAVPQIGPGEGNGDLHDDDFGRAGVTKSLADKYKFRTTPLRNVELTAPYGHDGAILTLRDFVRHYSESDKKLRAFDASVLEAPLRGTVRPTTEKIIAARDPIVVGVVFDDAIVDRLMAYMSALTDDAARDLGRVVPDRVPSGLPVLH